jgi:hypothetical protein
MAVEESPLGPLAKRAATNKDSTTEPPTMSVPCRTFAFSSVRLFDASLHFAAHEVIDNINIVTILVSALGGAVGWLIILVLHILGVAFV